MPPKLIDFRIKPPVRDGAGDPEVTIPPEYMRYEEVYGFRERLNIPLPGLLEEMEVNGVGPSILQAEHEWGEDRFWNDRVAEIVQAHPNRFACGFASVDPRLGMDAVRELNRAHHELGLRGVVFEPGFLQIPPTDRRCYPIYAKCVELGLPVGLHTGINFSSHGTIANGRPLLVDQVACDFPELILICSHGGWPWPHEAAAVAWKHANVYLEFGAISPRYQAPGAGGGWGDIAHLMDTVLRDKILFGTDWPMLRYDRALSEIDSLGLRDESLEAYLHGNAERLLQRILS
jgi:predicted TIM-barrel fold metal-dependent hydrolase